MRCLKDFFSLLGMSRVADLFGSIVGGMGLGGLAG